MTTNDAITLDFIANLIKLEFIGNKITIRVLPILLIVTMQNELYHLIFT